MIIFVYWHKQRLRHMFKLIKIISAVTIILFLLCYILPLLMEALWIKPAPEIRNKSYKEPMRVEVMLISSKLLIALNIHNLVKPLNIYAFQAGKEANELWQ